MRISLLVSVAAIPLLAATLPAAAEGRLSVLCGSEEPHCAALEAAFEAKTGVDVSMVRKSTGEILAQIRAEKDNPKVDVWWGGTGDPQLQAAEEGLLEPYASPLEPDLLGWAQQFAAVSKGQATGIYAGALGIGYNSELLAQKGVPAPECWADLIKEEYRGEIQIADPNTSGTAYTALATIVQLFDDVEAFTYLAALDKNVNSYTKSGSAPIKAAARGETMIGIAFMHDMVTQKQAGFPIEIVAPCEGTGYEIGAVSIIKGARNLDNAKLFVDFALSPEGQATGPSVGMNQTLSNVNSVVPEGAPDLKTIKLIDYDFATYGTTEYRTMLLARFAEEVRVIE